MPSDGKYRYPDKAGRFGARFDPPDRKRDIVFLNPLPQRRWLNLRGLYSDNNHPFFSELLGLFSQLPDAIS